MGNAIFLCPALNSTTDGTTQLVAKDHGRQMDAIAIIHRDFSEMQALSSTISTQSILKKAVIPAAGFGTRMFPATKVVKDAWRDYPQSGLCHRHLAGTQRRFEHY